MGGIWSSVQQPRSKAHEFVTALTGDHWEMKKSGERGYSAQGDRAAEVGFAWCREPVRELDPSAPPHHRVLLPNGKHASQTLR